ncbi:MAG: hypothetical protein ACHQJ5_07735, partial [Vicinamibacteria bacterium]
MTRSPRPRSSFAPLLASALVSLAVLAPTALADDDPARQSPFGGQLPPQLSKPASEAIPPPGFELSAAEAIEIADATRVVRDELAESPGAT